MSYDWWSWTRSQRRPLSCFHCRDERTTTTDPPPLSASCLSWLSARFGLYNPSRVWRHSSFHHTAAVTQLWLWDWEQQTGQLTSFMERSQDVLHLLHNNYICVRSYTGFNPKSQKQTKSCFIDRYSEIQRIVFLTLYCGSWSKQNEN